MEVLFQIPDENVEKAKPIIKELMENPFEGKIEFKVPLTVSLDTGQSYYEAK